jgi:signal transduction histidine kinase
VTQRRIRIVLALTTAAILAVVAVFAVALLSNRDQRRDAVKQRFTDEAKITSALISGLFDASAPQVAEQSAKRFGGEKIDPEKLAAYARRSRLSYIVILDGKGRTLATTPGADPDVLGAIAEGPSHVKEVLAGAPWRLSGITRGKVAESAFPYKSASGEPRVIVQGFPVQLVSSFVAGTLAKLPNADNERALVVDGAGRVISSAEGDVAPAEPAPRIGKGREKTSAGINNTDWSVQLSQAKGDLYAGNSATVQWLILIALATAGLVAVLLLRRAIAQAVAVRDANSRLEDANRDLERTNVELARSNNELEQFASVASHDLQEPLRKVQTFGDQLERRYADDLTDEAKDYLRRMRNASARMSVLIDDLLRFSRVTTQAKPHIRVDLDRIAREVLADLEARVLESGGAVDIEKLPAAQADPTQMRQLLQNLIANALKFHRDGVPPMVKIAPATPDDKGMVSFTVTDNGIGFESTYEERIFRVFERLHPRDVYSGTGIGLALCRKIVERHGGAISAEGRPGEGATFTVVLPAASPLNGKAPAQPAAARPPVHA